MKIRIGYLLFPLLFGGCATRHTTQTQTPSTPQAPIKVVTIPSPTPVIIQPNEVSTPPMGRPGDVPSKDAIRTIDSGRIDNTSAAFTPEESRYLDHVTNMAEIIDDALNSLKAGGKPKDSLLQIEDAIHIHSQYQSVPVTFTSFDKSLNIGMLDIASGLRSLCYFEASESIPLMHKGFEQIGIGVTEISDALTDIKRGR